MSARVLPPAPVRVSEDRAEIRRRRVTAQGGWAGLGTMGIALPYALLVGGPHRTLLIGAAASGVAISIAFALTAGHSAWLQRVRRSAAAGYALIHVAIVTVLAIADGGIGSPMSLGFFGTCVFCACSMPRRWMAAFGPVNIAGYLTAYLCAGSTRSGIVWVQLSGILATSLACAQQRHQLQRQRRVMAELARVDPLTRALNRRGFDEQLARATAAGERIALLLLDIDDFKQVNDLRGHAAGDELLVSVADALRDVCGSSASVARLGGDEFAALLPADDAGLTTERMRGELVRRGVAASVGMAVLDPAKDTAALLRAADHDLYARKAGRKRHRGARTGSLSLV
jgi:diguanylate cyclase (GGDEF)-like protein